MNDDNLLWLSRWYLSQCDNDWEHSYGVKIDTIDNPGWSLKIDLTDTQMEGRAFHRVEHGEPSGDLEDWQRTGSWWVARVEGDAFDVACGPLDLSSAVGVFRRWVEALGVAHRQLTLALDPEVARPVSIYSGHARFHESTS